MRKATIPMCFLPSLCSAVEESCVPAYPEDEAITDLNTKKYILILSNRLDKDDQRVPKSHMYPAFQIRIV